MLVDDTTQLTAKAGSQDENPVAAEFMWESGNESFAEVDDTGMVTGISNGSTMLTLTVVGRGIEIDVPVTVYKSVGSIVVAPNQDATLRVGATLALSATAYDEDDADMGVKVPGIAFTWASSDEDVATVEANDDDSSKATVTAVGAGSAEITASAQGETSDAVNVSVFEVEGVKRRLNVTNLPLTGTFLAATDSTGSGDPVTYAAAGTATLVPATISIIANVQQYNANTDAWANVDDDGAMVKFVSHDTDVITLDDSVAVTGGSGNATATLLADDSGTGQVVGRGTAVVAISTRYAPTIYIEVVLTLPANGKAGS